MTDNILTIIIVILIIGIIVFFYYNYNNGKTGQTGQISQLVNMTPKSKNDWIKYPKKYRKQKKHVFCHKIDVDDICSDSNLFSEKELDEEPEVEPYNDPEENNDSWDARFGIPLMDDKTKNKYAKKMIQENKQYGKSFGKFQQHQLDKNAIIKTDITIDPFKPENRQKYKGLAVKDIYDKQIAGPKPIPKKILGQTKTFTIYQDESEMNGGNITGANLSGYDNISSRFKSADLKNEF